MNSVSRLPVFAILALAGCSQSATVATNQAPAPAATTTAPAATTGGDARVGLKAGLHDAAEATQYLRVVSKTKPAPGYEQFTHSDIAFTGKYAVQGTYGGFTIWDVSNPGSPVLASAYKCPASQNDVSVYKQQLLFMSAEAFNGRLDCGSTPFTQPGISRGDRTGADPEM